MSHSPSALAGPIAALFPMLTSLCCLAYAFAWVSTEYVSTELVLGLFFAQPILSVMLLMYSESLKHEASPLRRIAFLLLCGVVFTGAGLFLEPKLWYVLTHPGVLLALLWAALGLVVDILLMRDEQRATIAAQAAAQGQDGFELMGLVLIAALIIAVPGGIAMLILKPATDPSPTLFALVPALYFAAYAGCVWRTHRPEFLANPKAWVEAPWIRRLYRFLNSGAPTQPD